MSIWNKISEECLQLTSLQHQYQYPIHQMSTFAVIILFLFIFFTGIDERGVALTVKPCKVATCHSKGNQTKIKPCFIFRQQFKGISICH